MSKKFKKPRKQDKDNEIEDLEKTLKNKKWECDFEVNSKYTFNYLQQSTFETLTRPETMMAIVDGPAGTAKTYIAVYAALKLISQRKIDDIVYIRSIVESASKSIGSLPGEVDEKFAPWAMPLNDKLSELVSPVVIKNLYGSGAIKSVPVNFARGLTFRNSFVIVDEAQNLTFGELNTILTRFGQNSKYCIIGDTSQSDIGKNSGFPKIVKAFTGEENDEKGIFSFQFTENEIVRSEILKFIVTQLKKVS
jgi:phosphate starvation-inducible PhoH-like protein